jgi:hypothetical protein
MKQNNELSTPFKWEDLNKNLTNYLTLYFERKYFQYFFLISSVLVQKVENK